MGSFLNHVDMAWQGERHTLNFAVWSVHKKIDALHQHWHKTAFFNYYKNVRIFSQKVIKAKYQGKLIQNQ